MMTTKQILDAVDSTAQGYFTPAELTECIIENTADMEDWLKEGTIGAAAGIIAKDGKPANRTVWQTIRPTL